jgi:hypothetical protein
MNSTNPDVKNKCDDCLFLLTYEQCKGCLDTDHGISRNYQAGDPFRHEWEMQKIGLRAIHIIGEADIFAKFTPEETFKLLYSLNPAKYKLNICKVATNRIRIELDMFGDLFFINYHDRKLFNITKARGKEHVEIWNTNFPKDN